MSRYSMVDLGNLWISEGGAVTAEPYAIAVAWAESGGNSDAVSPTSDYGLWQINSMNFAAYGLTYSTVFDPVHNVRVAIAMSDDGGNWGPWCTAWEQPVGNCGHYLGPAVQVGSAAAQYLTQANGAAGFSTYTPPPPPDAPAPQMDQLGAAWASTQYMAGSYHQAAHLAKLANAIRLREGMI